MPILIECDCGKSFRVKDELAGRKVRCPDCGDAVEVPLTGEVVDDEERDSDADREKFSPRRKPASRSSDRPKDLDPPKRAKLEAPPEPPSVQKKPRKRKRALVKSDDDGEWNFPLAVHPLVLSGLGLVVFGTVWLIVGLNNGRFYFYSPVPIVLGLVAIIRGFTGWD